MTWSPDLSTLPPPPSLELGPSSPAVPATRSSDLASTRRRVGGFVLDLLILSTAFGLFSLGLSWAITVLDAQPSNSTATDVGQILVSVVTAMLLSPLPLISYFAVSTRRGRTLGNWALHMRVVGGRTNGAISWGGSCGRGAVLGILLWLGILGVWLSLLGIGVALLATHFDLSSTPGFVVAGFALGVVGCGIGLAILRTARHPRHQAWHDRLSGAIVLRDGPLVVTKVFHLEQGDVTPPAASLQDWEAPPRP